MESRNLDYSYQNNLINECFNSLLDAKKTVLAASCGAGKTIMSIKIIKKYLERFPNQRILILTHGQSILRTQYYSVIKNYFPENVLFLLDANSENINESLSKKIVVSLPQTIYSDQNLREGGLGDFSLIVVDEAHNYYLVDDGMLQSIISKTNHFSELLLTASPSKFIAKNFILKNQEKYNIISFSSSDLVKYKVIIDPKIILLETREYQFNIKDYFSKDEIRKRKIAPNLTKNVLKETFDFIKNEYFHSSFKKGMIVATDEQHAYEINALLSELKISSLISTYSSDPDSIKIERFKREEKQQVLVVVQRGILGFDYPSLEFVIDLSFSLNPDRLFQMINRVVRVSNSKEKLFLKIMPHDLIEFSEISLSCASALSLKDVFDTYSGDYKNISVPILNKNEYTNQNNNSSKSESKYASRVHYIPNFAVMNFIFNENVEHQSIGKDVSLYAWTSFNEVKQKYLNITRWTLEKCKEEAIKYTRIADWRRNSPKSCSAAYENGWIQECTKHMIKTKNGPYTLEMCKNIALKFMSPYDWKKNHASSYCISIRNKWYKECIKHMEYKRRKPWKLEECQKEAKKFETVTQWKKHSSGSYTATRLKGWLNLCTGHMKIRKKVHWTLELCQKEAKKFETVTQWKKHNSGSYKASCKNGWISACTEHMHTKKATHTSTAPTDLNLKP